MDLQLRIPGRVWYDALDPSTSGMEAELGLPQRHAQPKGRGVTFVYENVSDEQATEVAEYLDTRAAVMSAQSGLDPNERELCRIMARTAETIRDRLRVQPA